tara:strand:- start:503 stop:832 length:330 start_codon:yes stop_codon:yes gene_type:complete
MSKLTFNYDVSFSGKTVFDGKVAEDVMLAMVAHFDANPEEEKEAHPSVHKAIELGRAGDLEGLLEFTIKQALRESLEPILKQVIAHNDSEESSKYSPIAIKFKPRAEKA